MSIAEEQIQPLAANLCDIVDHLYALFPPEFAHLHPDAWVEIAFGHPAGALNSAKIFSVFQLDAAAEFAEQQSNAGFNCYVGPALRGGDHPSSGRSEDASVIDASHSFMEFDAEGDDARIKSLLVLHNLKPAIAVTTGTAPWPRRHLYFRLAGAVTPDELRSANEALAQLFGSDPSVVNVAHVMRLAGSINRPKPKKQERGYITEPVTFYANSDAPAYAASFLIGLGVKSESEHARSAGYDGDRPELAEIADALDHLPNIFDRADYIRIGYAVWHGGGEDARDVFMAWAKRHASFDQSCFNSDWKSFVKGKLTTVGTLFWFARQAGWERKGCDRPEEEPKERNDPWPVLDAAALYGLPGDIIRLLEPHTEADPVGLLLELLATFGNIVGPAPYYLVESSKHRCNLFMVAVGSSSKGRKGTGTDRIQALTKGADEFWAKTRCVSGMSSGEGLINAVRDKLVKWDAKEKVEVVVDPGVTDKRLMVHEPEFAAALSVMERHGNTLNSVIRNAWDGKKLQTLTKHSPQEATDHHISIVAGITEAEARARLTRTDMANGFANRYLFCCVRRSKELPHGGSLEFADMAPMARRFAEAVGFARTCGRVRMSANASALWTVVYSELSAEKPGLLGAVIARAEAQTIRIAEIYALFDRSHTIEPVHLEAALAAWAYCEASAIRIFGDSLGDPVADEILRALRHTRAGMTRTDIRDLFSKHGRPEQISTALATLLAFGKVRFVEKTTAGRPTQVWFAT